MNASIGITTKEEKMFEENNGVTGQYGNNNRNTRGERLQNILRINELVSTAILFKKPNYNIWSFAGMKKNKKQLDHILVS